MNYDPMHGEPDDDEIPIEQVGRAMMYLRGSDQFQTQLQEAMTPVFERFLTGERQLADDEFDEVLDRALEGVLEELAEVRNENVEAHAFGVTEGTRFINHRKPDHMTYDAVVTRIVKYGTRLSYQRLDEQDRSPTVSVDTGEFVESDTFEIIDEGDDEDGGDDDRLTLA